MRKIAENVVRLSVRDLVEFVLKEGDIFSRRSGGGIQDAMLEGSKAHRRIQKNQGAEYEAEVPMKISVPLSDAPSCLDGKEEQAEAVLTIEGRADGVIRDPGGRVTIDEIKGIYQDIGAFREPLRVHLAQAVCYALILAREEELPGISVRITYVQLEEEDGVRKKTAKKDAEIRYFYYDFSFEEVRERFLSYVEYFRKWVLFIVRHRKERKASASGFAFPYEYRPGQREIVHQVYRTIRDGKRLYVQAPTGIGKTLAMLYPSVQAVGQEMSDKIFYLTAKTVTGTVAEEGLRKMGGQGLRFSYTRITAKEKMCPLEKMTCDPSVCPRAKGHFDRINEAVYDLLIHEPFVSSEVISSCAEKHCVCPYEMSLDVSLYTDVIICDYNYAFSPNVYLQRYFAGGGGDYIFLMDEAHNLVDRARDMYSAALVKEELLQAKKLFEKSGPVVRRIDKINRTMLQLKRECDKVTVFTGDTFPNTILLDLEELREALLRFMDRHPEHRDREKITDFFYSVSDFLDAAAYRETGYVSYSSFDEEDRFILKLFCIDPSSRLLERLDHITAAVFFSATFLPVNYYKELLSGNREEDAMYVNSPFDTERRALLLLKDVSSRYARRGYGEYRKIAEDLREMVRARKGNYLAFFPSHRFLSEVETVLQELLLLEEEKAERAGEICMPSYEILSQKRVMGEADRGEFLQRFTDPHKGEKDTSLLALSVTGGVFSEGIDLREEALIGVAVVGTGLPQVCVERELIRNYYEERGENGFDYAYRFPGINKVMQAAGRLIRTTEDEGVILLMDERFAYRDTRKLFPVEWNDARETVSRELPSVLLNFWDERRKKKQ